MGYENGTIATIERRRFVHSELNLEKNAVFTVSAHRGKSREVSIKTRGPNWEVIERTIVVGRTAEGIATGVLTTTHFKIYLALVELWEMAGKPVHDTVHFTVYKIIQKLGLQDDGRTYDITKRALYGLRQIPIEFIDSFYTKEDDFRSLKPFSILSYLDIYEHRNVGKRKETRGYGEFQFDRHILESLLNNYVHPLRLDIISSFRKHKDLAVLIYTFVDRSIALRNHFEIRLENLFKNLDLSQWHVKYPSDRKRVVEPVLNHIKGKELSTGILSKIEVVKTADGRDYKLVCHKKPFSKKLKDQALSSQLQFPILDEGSIEPEEPMQDISGLLSQLIGLGLTEKQAAKILLEVDPEVINAQIEYLPFRVREYQAQGKQINESAILYDSIYDNWSIPRGYFEAEKQKEREAKKLEEQRLTQLEQEEIDRAEQEKQEIGAYKATLSHEARAKLREKALEKINNTEGIKKEFITEMLIGIYENEILKLEMK